MRSLVPEWLAQAAINRTHDDKYDMKERRLARQQAAQQLVAIEALVDDGSGSTDADVGVYSWQVRYSEDRKALVLPLGLLGLFIDSMATIEPVLVPALGHPVLRQLMPVRRGPYSWRRHNEQRLGAIVDCVASVLDDAGIGQVDARALATEVALESGMLQPLLALYDRRLHDEHTRGIRLHSDYSNAELFFVLWALGHCGEQNAAILVNGALRNFAPFSRAFQCAINQAMWTGHRLVIRKECRERLDVFFAVTSETSDWDRRSDIRDTLLEGRVKRAFKWTGAFVLDEPRERLVTRWLEVEGDAHGDLIVLPPTRHSSGNATDVLRKVVRWATEHCAEVRYVIKMADDMVVHPMLLHKFLLKVDETEMGAVHCDMRGAFGPLRGTDFVAFAPRHKFFAGGFDVYCTAGSPVLASLKLLKDLDVASTSAGSETASSSDELQERHGHRTLHIWNLDFDDIIDVSLDANWNWTFVKLTGGTSRRRLDRRLQPTPVLQPIDTRRVVPVLNIACSRHCLLLAFNANLRGRVPARRRAMPFPFPSAVATSTTSATMHLRVFAHAVHKDNMTVRNVSVLCLETCPRVGYLLPPPAVHEASSS
ncbi:hypothetical protein HPB51_017541 [Rhipicephalus microplus]|uniref:Hexosyltransferase n=1 Tax=Rhipicephalus microplus TaxID=6941 RepID=A0A9J6EAX5_RHIMP|nr:hypothetical protein HPB51_017541 [Rhipicephalus microplus]